MLETLNKVEGLDQRLILGRRAKRQHVGQAKQFGSVGPKKTPHQGPIIIVVVGRDVLVTFPKDFGSTISVQNISHALAQGGVIVRRVEGLIEDIREDREHLFFKLAILVLQLFEVLLAEVVVRRMRLRSISTNWSRVWTWAW